MIIIVRQTEHPNLSATNITLLPQSNAHRSHRTPTEQCKYAVFGNDKLARHAVHLKMHQAGDDAHSLTHSLTHFSNVDLPSWNLLQKWQYRDTATVTPIHTPKNVAAVNVRRCTMMTKCSNPHACAQTPQLRGSHLAKVETVLHCLHASS